LSGKTGGEFSGVIYEIFELEFAWNHQDFLPIKEFAENPF